MRASASERASTVAVSTTSDQPCAASLAVDQVGSGVLTLTLTGCLNVHTTGRLWRESVELVSKHSPSLLVVDASSVDYCDVAGIGLLLELRRHQADSGSELRLQGLRQEFLRLLELFGERGPERRDQAGTDSGHLVEEFGRATLGIWAEIREQVEFVGELAATAVRATFSPVRVRWRDTLRVVELAGVDALGIVVLIGFLMGLIMAFESAMPMRRWLAHTFVTYKTTSL